MILLVVLVLREREREQRIVTIGEREGYTTNFMYCQEYTTTPPRTHVCTHVHVAV